MDLQELFASFGKHENTQGTADLLRGIIPSIGNILNPKKYAKGTPLAPGSVIPMSQQEQSGGDVLYASLMPFQITSSKKM